MNETVSKTDLPAVGVDIAKAKFDACLWRTKPLHKTFANTPEGCAALLAWLAQHGVTQAHVCLEATSTYGNALARFGHERGQRETPYLTGRATGIGKGVLNGGWLTRIFHTLVARISNPLYRRASSLRRARKDRRGWFSTPCRLEICATAGQDRGITISVSQLSVS